MLCDKKCERENTELFWFIFVALVAFLPFIVYARVVYFDGIIKELYNKAGNVNFFSWYRAIWLYVLTIFGWIGFFLSRKSKLDWYFKPLFVFAFFNVLSTAISKYPSIALWGNPERHEGLLTNLCYLSITLFFAYLVLERKKQRTVLFSILVSAFLLGMLGAFQFFGLDYFHSAFTDHYLIPEAVLELAPGWDFLDKPRETYSIFSTFGNSNFTGSYLAMLFPLSWFFLYKCQSKTRYLAFLLNAVLFVNLIGAKSRASILAVFVVIMIAMVFLKIEFRKNLSLTIVLLGTYAILFFAMEAYSIKGQFRLLDTFFVRKNSATFFQGFSFDDIELKDNEAKLTFGNLSLKVRLESSGELLFFNSNSCETSLEMRYLRVNELGQPFADSVLQQPTKDDPGKIILAASHDEIKVETEAKVIEIAQDQDKSLWNRLIDMNNLKILRLIFKKGELPGYEIYFLPQVNILKVGRGGPFVLLKVEQQGFSLLNYKLKKVSCEEPPAIGFKGREFFGSGRGYIWSRTLPLLKKAIFIGYGPDTFVAHFPNNDVVGKLKYWGTMRLIFEKPHSFYLQIAMNSGVIALLAFLSMIFVYLKDSCKIYFFNPLDDFSFYSGAGICLAVLGYLIAGIFNDSVVAVAPVFWGLLGLGIATNRMNRMQLDGVDGDC